MPTTTNIMNQQSSLATGIRVTGIDASLNELDLDIARLEEVVSEIRQKTAPLRLESPPEPQSAASDAKTSLPARCEIDERIQNARRNVRSIISRIERTYEEIKL